MTDKYYTPKIEEFHVGFEFEKMDLDTAQWGTCILKSLNETFDDMPIIDNLDNEVIRVKRLDRKDIEGEGFEFLHEDENESLFFVFKKGTTIKDRWKLRLEKDHRVWITQGHEWTRFLGILNNISELRKILIQTGVK